MKLYSSEGKPLKGQLRDLTTPYRRKTEMCRPAGVLNLDTNVIALGKLG